jgi:hypothetical protein
MDACPDFIGVVNPAIAGSIFQRSQFINIGIITEIRLLTSDIRHFVFSPELGQDDRGKIDDLCRP